MAINNHYLGEVTVTIGGKPYTLAFTFAAKAKLKTIFGDADLYGPLREMEFEKIAQIMECGLARHHPEMTAERIMQEVVPLAPAIEAVADALRYSITGGLPPAEGDKPGPPAKAAARKTA